jgi:hypothetical protein
MESGVEKGMVMSAVNNVLKKTAEGSVSLAKAASLGQQEQEKKRARNK